MKLQSVVIALSLIFATADFAEARLRGSRRSSPTGSHGEYVATEYSTEKRYDYNGEALSLQGIAQLRADAMAKHHTLTHGIHGIAPVPKAPLPEGIGYSTKTNYKSVSTCICGSTVVADAWCKSSNGYIYRVRFWK
jgi:hypothetical protein